MNKEMTPLEWLNYYKKIIKKSNITFRPNGFEMIEAALKEKETEDKILKLLKEKPSLFLYADLSYPYEVVCDELEENYKKGKPTKQELELSLTHELTHALLAESGRIYKHQFNTEELCEFVAWNLEEIKRLKDKILKERLK